MKTLRYQVILFVAQIVLAVTLLINLAGIVYFYFKKLKLNFELSDDHRFLKKCFDFGLYFSLGNILLSILGFTSISSSIKPLMDFYQRITTAHVVASLLMLLAFRFIFRSSIINAVEPEPSLVIGKNIRLMSVDSPIAPLEDPMELINNFIAVHLSTVLFNIVLILLFRYAISVKLTKKDKLNPKIKISHNTGLTSNEIIKYDIIDVYNPISMKSG